MGRNYGNVNEAIPHNAPAPIGKPAILTHYVDAGLLYNEIARRSVTHILHFINGTPST